MTKKKINIRFKRCKHGRRVEVNCVTTSDCPKNKKEKVCMESSETGEKTCSKPNQKTCTTPCADGEYCIGMNICRNGMAYFKGISNYVNENDT